MIETKPAQVLLDICNLVESEMADGAVCLPGKGFFAAELETIQQRERRDFLTNYICESMIALLLGVLDQAKCLALSLDTPGIAISPFILMRCLLEYGYKITYLADAGIQPEERIRRSLMLYLTDIREYRKMPWEYRSVAADQHASNGKEMAGRWYQELTGKQLNTVSTKAIMDSVWNAGSDMLQGQDPGQNDIYEKGYRSGSVVTHGNTWAIRYFCLEKRSDTAGTVLIPRLRERVLYGTLEVAARILQLSFGFVVQFGSTLPAHAMNRLEEKIYELVTLRAAAQPS